MVSLQPCFVLHLRPYRETSALIEVYSEQAGRAGLIAKGARRPRSPFRGLLQPFAPLLLSWSGRGELGTLTGAEPAHGADGPQGLAGARVSQGLHGAQIFQGMYLNELVMRLLHRHDPHPELFVVYARTLEALAASPPQGSEAVLRRFEVALLDATGYGMVLDHDADTGESISADACYRYLAERGPVRAADGEGGDHDEGVKQETSNNRNDLYRALAHGENDAGLAVSGRTLLWLGGAADEDADTARQAKRLMRFVVRPLLGDRPLATRSLFSGPRTERPTSAQ